MIFTDTLRGLWRRWYILLPGTLIAAVLALSVWSIVPPGYERSSTQLLIPGAQSIPAGANPYLFLGGLTPAADVVVRAVGSENLLNEVDETHPGVKIELTRDMSTAGPIILTVVTANSNAAAEEVLGFLGERTTQVLNEIQETEGIAAENRMTVLPVTIDNQSVLKERNRFLAAGAAGLLVLTLTLLVSGLVDGLNLRRKRRGNRARSATPPTGEPNRTRSTAGAPHSASPPRSEVRLWTPVSKQFLRTFSPAERPAVSPPALIQSRSGKKQDESDTPLRAGRRTQ